MKKIISIMIAITLILTGCASISASTIKESGQSEKTTLFSRSTIKGSGKAETKTFDLKDFKNISASHVFDVTIEKSDDFNVEVTYDDNLAEYITVKVKGDTLKLSMSNKYNYNNAEVKATIKMPDIYGIQGSGATNFQLKEGLHFDHDFDVDLSGVSKLRGKIKTGDIDIDLSGCSDVTFEGSGKDLSCDSSGVSGVDLENFKVDNADVNISGSGTSVINTDGKIKVHVSGTSTLKYKGDATIESLDVSGVAGVKKIK